jgi:hypothetical protein
MGMSEEEIALLKDLAQKEQALSDRLQRIEILLEKIAMAMGITPH